MSRFRPINREIDFLLPPSVQDWLPEGHLARYVVEVVEGLDLSELERSDAGRGSAPDHPATLLSLLIDGDATGGFSSRKIERATDDSLAFRFIAANRPPDHETLSTFRKRFAKEFEAVFVQVLQVARENPLSRFGTVSRMAAKFTPMPAAAAPSPMGTPKRSKRHCRPRFRNGSRWPRPPMAPMFPTA